MKKCEHCQWHRKNITVIFGTLKELTQGGGYDDLMTDFELSLCWSQGCTEPTSKFMDQHGDDIARTARLQLRRDMGVVEFTKTFPHWALELRSSFSLPPNGNIGNRDHFIDRH
jgi:hypothetical protein